MDNPSSESSALDLNQAAALLGSVMDPTESPQDDPKNDPKPDTDIDLPTKADAQSDEPPAEEEAPEPGAQKVTIEVDGKTVELTQEQIAEAYKNGLRQSDYTKKTMEAAEHKKSADAEIAKARSERDAYANKLQKFAIKIESDIEQHDRLDWDQLSKSDPAEYVRQMHLAQARQAQLQQVNHELQITHAAQQEDFAKATQARLATEREALLEKLPAWKDQAKAATEHEAIKGYLKAEGYAPEDIAGIQDHRAVVLARKAMLYDQMVAKAKTATAKVATLPAKVIRPGVTENTSLDKRGSAYQRLTKSGSVNDAAAALAGFL